MSFNLLLLTFIMFSLRLYLVNNLGYKDLVLKASRLFVSSILFYLMATLTALNYLFDYYSSVYYLSNLSDLPSFVSNALYDKFLMVSSTSLSAVDVYLYPFIYVFILVTAMSIVFCLTYNLDELSSFMFYCLIILLSGYSLFFTDSMIIFFFSYEMLLVPSFFILYKFAKTRRCVEAAYLMFFWTQFGALFLIICLIYLFFIVGSSSFSLISTTYISTFEVNFMFMCLIFGFGVKLPIWPFYG